MLRHKSMIAKVRADVSALLIIAFVFQLVWPIAALATDVTSDDYETALRNNICQVVLEEQAEKTNQNLSDVICDWCVLNCAPAYHLVTGHSETEYKPVLGHFLVTYGRDDVFQNLAYSYLGAPRAPPFSHS